MDAEDEVREHGGRGYQRPPATVRSRRGAWGSGRRRGGRSSRARAAARPPTQAEVSWPAASSSCLRQQRVRNRQPDGGLAGLGTSPWRMIRSRACSRCGSGSGTADSSACVYGWPGALVDLVAGARLDDLAEVHHRDAIGDVADHRQVVGDEDVGQAEGVLELLEQVDDAGLDRHVEGRHRLVEHDQLGLEGQGPGDADPLALPAGELVRVAVGVLGREADRWRAARCTRVPVRPRSRAPWWTLQRLGQGRARPSSAG